MTGEGNLSILTAEMEWFYASDRDEQIPVSENDLESLAADGVIRPDTLVWHEGMGDWKPCREVRPALFGLPETAASAMALTPALPYRPTTVQPTDGLALASLICGICGLVFMPCYGAGIPLSIAAVICGHLSRNRLRLQGGGGEGMALGGLITGYIALGLFALGFLMMIGMFLFVGAAATTVPPQ